MSTTAWTQTALLHELSPVVEGELNRHIKVAKEWFPHDYVPWSDGRNYDGLMGGEPWSPDDAPISDVARSALIVNLLTEDNLPSYHHEIAIIFGRDDAWGEWVHRWTAEEGRHSVAMRDYMSVKRLVDPVDLERHRMSHMSTGYESQHSGDMMRSLAYVSFQELATRISHRNTGTYTNDPLCEQLLQRIAADENLHMIFYRNLLKGALDLSPDQAMCAAITPLSPNCTPNSTKTDVITSCTRDWRIMMSLRPTAITLDLVLSNRPGVAGLERA